MIFRFYIDNVLVDEPVGFDATKIKLKRSDNWHGIMAETDSQSVEFYGLGYRTLKTLYDADGIDASATLLIQYACNGTYEDLGEYSITFYNSEWFCGNDCYCKVGLERKGCLYRLTNAADTKVNLDTVLGIDGVTALGSYDYLGKYTEVPSKTIVLSSQADSDTEITDDITTEVDAQYDINYTGVVQIATWLPFETQKVSDAEEFTTSNLWDTTFGAITDEIAATQYIFKNTVTAIQCIGNDYDITLDSSGTLAFTTSATLSPISVNVIIAKRSGSTPTTLYSSTLTNTGSGFDYIYSWDIDTSLTVTLAENDLILMYVFVNAIKTTTGAFTAFSVTHGAINETTITTDSICVPTESKLYMVNEALSRTTEYVTDNCLQVYSEFLGREDSQPYNFSADGCGGMLAITKGELLRRLETVRTGDQTPIFTVSFNDIINAIDSIYNIGYAIETIGLNEVLRVEDWRYFYQDTVVCDIGTVSIKKEPNLPIHIKNFKTGYDKYEAEEYNGLDEFLTEREYSTRLVNHNASLDKVCKFIASGYAIEITRRKGYADTKDWRFDTETFILCMERQAYNDIQVEQANILNDANIIDAPTVLNFRISPARMAMSWFTYITTFIKDVRELVFTSGKGNIAAEGELVNVCTSGNGVISEKQNITQSAFNSDQSPIYTAELHKAEEIPLTFEQYKAFRANPHGLFAYKCDSTQLYGWVKELEYSFVNGSADITLIPKV